MKAYARFDEILNVGYFLNELSILYMEFVNLAPLWRHLYGRDDRFFISNSKGDLTMMAYAKSHGFLSLGYFLNRIYVLDVTFTLSNTVLCL